MLLEELIGKLPKKLLEEEGKTRGKIKLNKKIYLDLDLEKI